MTRTKIPKPYNTNFKLWWSGKDKFHALKYEVAVSLGEHCRIVFVSGSYPGSHHDLTIARNSSLLHLEDGESVVVDSGYRGDHRCIPPRNSSSEASDRENRAMSFLRQNVERMNRRIKIFEAAKSYRGCRMNHSSVFFACCYLTNLELEVTPLNGEKPERDPLNCDFEL